MSLIGRGDQRSNWWFTDSRTVFREGFRVARVLLYKETIKELHARASTFVLISSLDEARWPNDEVLREYKGCLEAGDLCYDA